MAEKSTLTQSLMALARYADGDDSEVTVKQVKLKNPPQYTATEVKAIRGKVAITQRVLARVLAVSPRTVEAWETGRSIPSGSARRLLQLIDKDPEILKTILV